MRLRPRWRLLWLGVLALICAPNRTTAASAESDLKAARGLWQEGRYAEALDAFEALPESLPAEQRTAAVIGVSDVFVAIGEYAAAIEAIRTALADNDADANLWGRLAEIHYQTGEWDAARDSAERALKLDTEALRGRLILAHLDREAGRLDAAVENYRWFVRYYNRVQPTDAVTLRLVAEGSLEYARWKRVSSVFHFVVNTLAPDALQNDPRDWPTHVLAGELLLEKYNSAQARTEFEAATKINPFSAEAQVGLARLALQDHEPDRALELVSLALTINPQLVSALVLRAELALDDDDAAAAEPFLQRALQINPRDQSVLACQAMALLSAEGLPTNDRLQSLLQPLGGAVPADFQTQSKFEELLISLIRRNPRPGIFLNRLGEYCEARRRFGLAEQFFSRTVAVMPQLAAAQTNLGLLYMRTGKLDKAEAILEDAFKADPFHVRVSNMRKVVGVLKGYETIRTEHFVVRVDAADRMLGEYMAEYLEEVHGELAGQYRYTPPTPTQFEVFNKAKGQTAHQWFSARMIGLPWIQTIGASTGMIVSMASPTAVDVPFHWGRVLRHEYVHILTLQQTDFNIPHWYTEALAVRTEDIVLPREWKTLLLDRVPDGELFTLTNLNLGFQHPTGPDDWNLAYCLSRQYARFIESRWGAPALSELVDCYRDGLATPAAIQRVCGLSLSDFESAFRSDLEQFVTRLRESQATPVIDVDAARKARAEHPHAAAYAGRLAYALLDDDQTDAARAMAEEARTLDPRDPFAAATLARIELKANRSSKAVEILEAVHQRDRPHPVVLALLAEQAFQGDQFERAEQLFQLGVDRFPLEDAFWKGLAVTQLTLGATRDDVVEPVLIELARRDPENTGVRRKLALIALGRGNFDGVRHWARELLFIDLEDAQAHELLGRAHAARGELNRSRSEYERAIEFDPERIDARLGLARLDLEAGRRDDALSQVRTVLRMNPDHAEAAALLERLQGQPADR